MFVGFTGLNLSQKGGIFIPSDHFISFCHVKKLFFRVKSVFWKLSFPVSSRQITTSDLVEQKVSLTHLV